MKRNLFTILCFLISVVVSAQSINTFDDLVNSEKKFHKNIFAPRTTVAANTYNLKYHRCNWYLDPAIASISGSITSYFTVTAQPFTEIHFDLSSALSLDSVIYSGNTINFNRNGDDVQCLLQANIFNGTLDSITLYYHGTPVSSGFGSFNQTTHAGIPVLWTLSEPYGASDWWPCKNNLNDKIDSIDILIETPLQYRAASNGILLSEIPNGGNKIYHWQSHYPIATYLIAIAVTNYAVYSDYVPMGNDSLAVLNYVYPEELATWQAGTPDIISTIQLYNSLVTPYPFANEKYGHCQFGWGGGMEHQTMSFVITGTYHPLLAHECAHQWFGDKITCGSWEDIWLNEGFATYFEGLTEQYIYPQDWYAWKISKLSSITSAPDGSVKCTDTTDIGRIFNGRLSYNKGSYLLHMLRWQLGDSAFFNGLRNYLNDTNLAYGYANTPDLKFHLENVSGQNLTTFFNQWYMGEGYPSYQIIWNQNGQTVNVKINQTTSHPSVSFYEMPVPLKFTNAVTDTVVVLNNTFSGQQYTFNLPFSADSAIFDPDLWLISANNSVSLGYTDEAGKATFCKVYPNPASKFIYIEFDDRLPENIFVDDVSGKNIISLLPAKRKNAVDVSGFSKGNYMIRLNFENRTYSYKITVQ